MSLSEAKSRSSVPVQMTLLRDTAAGEYRAPDHSAGDAWPGTQTPMRQLSLFETPAWRRLPSPPVARSSAAAVDAKLAR